jgi:hypothetical protein
MQTIGNLEIPKLFETWDNPKWVGEEANKYRNICKSEPISMADEIMSHEYYIKWTNCAKWSVDEIYIKIKYKMWAEDMELQFIPEEFLENVNKAKKLLDII